MVSLFSGNYMYLLTYKKPGTVLGAEATEEVSKTKVSPLWSLHFINTVE